MRLLSNEVKFLSCAASPILLLLIAAALSADGSATRGHSRSLAAAETAFAQESLEKGIRTAFLDVLSDDGIVFQPGPQNGKKAFEAKSETSQAVLQWQPVLAAVSTNGDLGYTTGPSTYKKNASDTHATVYGQFVSIWRWENGKWKLLFDIGSQNPGPSGPPPELQLVDNHAPNESAIDAQPLLLAHDRRYAADRAGQLAASAEEHVRLIQPEKFPVVGRAEAAAVLQKTAAPIKFGPPKAEVSRGGDLGYLWGEYTAAPASQPTGYYLRIWRKDRAGAWKLALDLLHPR
jgi:ketosteroid isomerase-like protein